MKTIASLFEEEPEQWGLRGDPFLWRELSETIGDLPLPDTNLQFIELLTSTIERLIGYPITHHENVFIERFAHGGMSSGEVCPPFWREEAIPMLEAKYRSEV